MGEHPRFAPTPPRPHAPTPRHPDTPTPMKLSITDLDLANGQTGQIGLITVTMGECRVPADNPSGDAFALVSVRTAADDAAILEGWLIASAPALNALDHPRYDVWALRCAGG